MKNMLWRMKQLNIIFNERRGDMFTFFKNKEVNTLYAPISGKKIAIEKVDDPLFSKEMLGASVAFLPSKDCVVSPCVGEITMITPTLHACGIQTKDGMEILIHIGIDSVMLKGKGFKTLCHVGDHVEIGTPLIQCDFSMMKDNHIDTTVIMIITNSKDYQLSLDKDEKKVISGKTKLGEGVKC